MNRLERLTTEYVEREDRIRLSGQLTHGDTVVLWLTRETTAKQKNTHCVSRLFLSPTSAPGFSHAGGLQGLNVHIDLVHRELRVQAVEAEAAFGVDLVSHRVAETIDFDAAFVGVDQQVFT